MIPMRSLILSFFVLLTMPVVPTSAQEQTVKSATETDAGMKERLALAAKMHDVWPIRTRIESAISSIAENYPPEQQVQMKAAMRKAIKFDQIEEESTKAMADIYTAEELTAMIDFYGSDTGRAISAKTPEYERALTPVLTQMIDKAMLDLRTGTP